MGQYHLIVNIDKREYLNPHKLGNGLKLWEQLAANPSSAIALIPLLSCANGRGGGDLRGDTDVIGRWVGDRVVWVGDYTEDGDIPFWDRAANGYGEALIYDLCSDLAQVVETLTKTRERLEAADGKTDDLPEYMRRWLDSNITPENAWSYIYSDITDMVCEVLEYELEGKFVGKGWRQFQRNGYIDLAVREQDAHDLLRVVKFDLPEFARDLSFTLDYRQAKGNRE